ncbi:MAG: hypothetical protein ABSE46_23495 [Terracidiphilus sp.]|jgi:hypothetical protein
MDQHKHTVTFFDIHDEAEEAGLEIQWSGFNMESVSVIAKDDQAEDEVVGYHSAGDRIRIKRKLGICLGRIWGLLVGAAFLWIPGLGLCLLQARWSPRLWALLKAPLQS